MKSTLFVIAVICITLSEHAAAQAVRQESTNQLKKVVYSGKCADFRQELLVNLDISNSMVYYGDAKSCPAFPVVTNGSYYSNYFAVVPIPELTLVNMPSIACWTYSKSPNNLINAPMGWNQASDINWWVDEGNVRLYWFCDSCWRYTNFTAFKLVITYESGQSINASAANPGTGKSLQVNWNPDMQTSQRITGYKVYRKEKQSP